MEKNRLNINDTSFLFGGATITGISLGVGAINLQNLLISTNVVLLTLDLNVDTEEIPVVTKNIIITDTTKVRTIFNVNNFYKFIANLYNIEYQTMNKFLMKKETPISKPGDMWKYGRKYKIS
jgi:hypothetical protein